MAPQAEDSPSVAKDEADSDSPSVANYKDEDFFIEYTQVSIVSGHVDDSGLLHHSEILEEGNPRNTYNTLLGFPDIIVKKVDGNNVVKDAILQTTTTLQLLASREHANVIRVERARASYYITNIQSDGENIPVEMGCNYKVLSGETECKNKKTDPCTWNSKTQKCQKGNQEFKFVKAGGKAQLRAVRDAIRQYEAQSGKRQLAARRSFNRAKAQMASA